MIRFRVLIALLLSLLIKNTSGQESDTLRKGIHQEESEYYSAIYPKDQPAFQSGKGTPSAFVENKNKSLTAKVLGWHPYWASATAYLYYDYEAISHIAYFSYEVDTATGGYTSIRGWDSTPVIEYAHQRGTKVLLTVTNFGTARNTELLSDTVKQKYMLTTLVALLKSRNGDGVNFDLESVALSQKANLVNFMKRAVKTIKKEIPSAEISMATPAVDWSGSWDLRKLSETCDYLILMGYNYYWSGSATAGPVAPLGSENYNVSKSVETYLGAGVTPDKLMLGVPWYGYDWPVVDNIRKSAATGAATSKTLAAAEDLAHQYSKTFDVLTSVPWVKYMYSAAWRQLWYDDNESLMLKYEYSRYKNLAGIGIWALSYEGLYHETWDTIKSAFSAPLPENSALVKVYPNPATGTAFIEFTLASKADITLKICDMAGKVVVVLDQGEREPGYYKKYFSASRYGQGMYICSLHIGKTRSIRKFIIIK